MSFWEDLFGGFGTWDDITGVTASENAAEAMREGNELAIAEQQAQREQQQAQFDAQFAESQKRFGEMRADLNPYMEAGAGAIQQQQALSGALGPQAQQRAYEMIQSSPGFQAALQQGETSILQNAAATGGVRGGNTQGALAQYSPQLLGQAVDQRYSQLGGLAHLGQASAAGVGAAGMGVVPGIAPTDNSVASMLQQGGQQQGANIMGQYNLQSSFISDVAGLAISIAGLV